MLSIRYLSIGRAFSAGLTCCDQAMGLCSRSLFAYVDSRWWKQFSDGLHSLLQKARALKDPSNEMWPHAGIGLAHGRSRGMIIGVLD